MATSLPWNATPPSAKTSTASGSGTPASVCSAFPLDVERGCGVRSSWSTGHNMHGARVAAHHQCAFRGRPRRPSRSTSAVCRPPLRRREGPGRPRAPREPAGATVQRGFQQARHGVRCHTVGGGGSAAATHGGHHGGQGGGGKPAAAAEQQSTANAAASAAGPGVASAGLPVPASDTAATATAPPHPPRRAQAARARPRRARGRSSDPTSRSLPGSCAEQRPTRRDGRGRDPWSNGPRSRPRLSGAWPTPGGCSMGTAAGRWGLAVRAGLGHRDDQRDRPSTSRSPAVGRDLDAGLRGAVETRGVRVADLARPLGWATASPRAGLRRRRGLVRAGLAAVRARPQRDPVIAARALQGVGGRVLDPGEPHLRVRRPFTAPTGASPPRRLVGLGGMRARSAPVPQGVAGRWTWRAVFLIDVPLAVRGHRGRVRARASRRRSSRRPRSRRRGRRPSRAPG